MKKQSNKPSPICECGHDAGVHFGRGKNKSHCAVCHCLKFKLKQEESK